MNPSVSEEFQENCALLCANFESHGENERERERSQLCPKEQYHLAANLLTFKAWLKPSTNASHWRVCRTNCSESKAQQREKERRRERGVWAWSLAAAGVPKIFCTCSCSAHCSHATVETRVGMLLDPHLCCSMTGPNSPLRSSMLSYYNQRCWYHPLLLHVEL